MSNDSSDSCVRSWSNVSNCYEYDFCEKLKRDVKENLKRCASDLTFFLILSLLQTCLFFKC